MGKREVELKASVTPDPTEHLAYADAVDYRDKMLAEADAPFRAEIEWRRRNAEGDRVKRQAIAARLGVSVRSMRHAGRAIDEREMRFRETAE